MAISFKSGGDTMPMEPPPQPTAEAALSPAEVIARGKDVDAAKDAAQYNYDLIVIGGGSGGLAAAKKAADHGATVALFDFVKPSPAGTKWGLGGTCVNVGCIPKKLMHTAALHGEAMRHHAPHFGFEASAEAGKTVDWDTLRGNVVGHVKSLNFGYKNALKSKQVKYVNAYASFVDAHTIDATAGDGTVTKYTARRFLIATGGRPTVLDIPGKELAITSDDIFHAKKDPGATLVVGASYVALECAGFLTGIGRSATVMMRSIPLRGFDQDMANRAVEFMELEGTKFIRGHVPVKIEKADDGKLIVTHKGSDNVETQSSYDTVLFAVGRKPETDKIGLDKAGVQLNDKGQVIVDQFERTNIPHIYAIGDIIQGGLELTPIAIAAGNHLADRIYKSGSKLMNYKTVPTTVFTPLEYGAVGYSEEDAQKKFGVIDVYHSAFTPLEWTVPNHADSDAVPSNKCYMKLIVNPFDNERVLGFHILAPHAGEITQGVAVALKCNAVKANFDETIGIHPTVAEDMTTLKITKRSGQDAGKTGC